MMRVFLFALTLLLASGASAQTPKSAGTATALSVLVPGGGHLYAGETLTGAALLGAAAVGAGIAVTAWERVECTGFGCAPEFSEYYDVNQAQVAVGLGVAGATWLIGVVGASGATRRANQRMQVSFAPRLDGGATTSLRVRL